MKRELENETAIQNLLEDFCAEERGSQLFELLRLHDESNYANLVKYVSSKSKPLKELLEQDSLFNTESPLMISHGENGATSFQALQVARILLKKAAVNCNPNDALDWLKKVLATESATGSHIMSISDIETEVAIDFDNGARLVPLEQIPESRSKEFSLDRSYIRRSSFISVARPTSALILPARIESYFWKERAPVQKEEDVFRSYNILDGIRLALSCVGPCCPVNAGYWFSYDDRDLDDAMLGGGSMTKMIDIQNQYQSKTRRIDPQEARQVVNAFLGLEKEVASRCLIALDRLNQSIRRSASRGDKCLDLAMALEALLVNDSGEHSYKVSLRAALLAGQRGGDLLRYRAIAKALYDVRSKLVHTGKDSELVKLPSGYGPIRTYDLISEAEELVSNVLKEVIERGRLPNWFEFELNQGA